MTRVGIIDTTFRDAHQSLIATRLTTDEMLRVAEDMDRIGFYSMEVWGGATFDVCIRYLREDPWERLRLLRESIKKTKLQMLLRGQNVVGYRHYPDDVVKKFVELAHRNGIDIFRVFDALNDVRNMKTAIKAAKDTGGEVQGAIAYTTGKMFTIDYYMKKVNELIDLDVDTITIKDMAALLTPRRAYELVREIKETYGIPVNVHTHSTTGMAVATYMKAVEAGVDYIDTSISPLAFGTAQPGIQTVWHALPEAVGSHLDAGRIHRISRYLKKLIDEKYFGLLHRETLMVNPYVLEYQVPGGMFSNLIAQLREMNALDRLEEVLQEIPRVREDLGWPPLVTPSSQIVGTQAVLNVLFGRYKRLTREVVDYIMGRYGAPPGEINPSLKERALKEAKQRSEEPSMSLDECREKLRGHLKTASEEDVLTYCLFPEVAPEFFKARASGKKSPALPARAQKVKIYVNGVEFEVGIEGVELGRQRQAPISRPAAGPREPSTPSVAEVTPKTVNAGEGTITSPMPGKIKRILVQEGESVRRGQVLLILEAMKMENEVEAPYDGIVKRIHVGEGEAVTLGQPLLELRA